MKYFSQDWHSGNLSSAESDAIRDAYWVEIEAIKSKLPQEILELATKINLHDGIVRHITLEKAAKRLTMALRCGDLQVGYFDIEIMYIDVEITNVDSSLLKIIATDAETELLYDEIGIASANRFVHRILFYPYREIEVIFGKLKFAIQPKADRELGDHARQYRETPKTAA